MTNRFNRFSFTIYEIYRSWHRIASEVMKEYGLKGSSAVYFTTMYETPEGVTATQLSELCSRNKADVSRMIAQMIEKGFARREDLGNNSYRAKLYLTDSGRTVAESISNRALKAANLGSSGMTDRERDNMYAALELIAKNLKDVSRHDIVKF